MKQAKRRNLESAGWRVGGAADFLGLSREEAALVELKVALSTGIKQRRLAKGLTQGELATRLGSSQSRIAKIEGADPSVSIDLLIRALFAMGTSRAQVARIVGRRPPRAA